MQKKVLIVDDSALMRRVLSDIINTDARFLVTKVATNGLDALNLIVEGKDNYDAVILDINMPKMNGIELLEQLERFNIKLTVIMVSTLAKEGAKETIQALELGAFDFVTKPESFLEVKSDEFKNKLINCLVLATKLDQSVLKPDQKENQGVKAEEIKNAVNNLARLVPTLRPSRKIRGNSRLVTIACSTGGPKALQQIVPALPGNLDCSVLIVQHMPEGFTYSLAHRLNELSQVEVKEAEHGEVLRKGVVYIAQGGRQMRVIHEKGMDKISITQEPARNGLKPCADIMLESLADSEFDDIICVVLTGMGGDGTSGIKSLIKNKNIYVIAQNEETCTVYGMPKVITEAGLVNEIVSLSKVTEAITKNLGVQ
jgi:two-component system chemotaxis response regulator CheB